MGIEYLNLIIHKDYLQTKSNTNEIKKPKTPQKRAIKKNTSEENFMKLHVPWIL